MFWQGFEKRAADHPEHTFTVKVRGDEASKRFRNLIETLSRLGNWGASREIRTYWDGDGPDKLEVVDNGGMEHSEFDKDFTDGNAVDVRYDGIKRKSGRI